MPEMTIQTEEVKAGNWEFPHKVILSATVNDVTLTRGVIRNSSDMWLWITASITGFSARRNVMIEMMDRKLENPVKRWHLYECTPIRYKPGSDLDATTPDVSIAELDISYNYFIEEEVNSVT